jgi:hypothetical protein
MYRLTSLSLTVRLTSSSKLLMTSTALLIGCGDERDALANQRARKGRAYIVHRYGSVRSSGVAFLLSLLALKKGIENVTCRIDDC